MKRLQQKRMDNTEKQMRYWDICLMRLNVDYPEFNLPILTELKKLKTNGYFKNKGMCVVESIHTLPPRDGNHDWLFQLYFSDDSIHDIEIVEEIPETNETEMLIIANEELQHGR